MRGYGTTKEYVKSSDHIHLNCVSMSQILFSRVIYSSLMEAKSLFVFRSILHTVLYCARDSPLTREFEMRYFCMERKASRMYW